MVEINSHVNLGDINFDQLFPDDISQKNLLNKNFIKSSTIILNIIYYKCLTFKKKVGIQLNWQSAALARQRSAVRDRLSPIIPVENSKKSAFFVFFVVLCISKPVFFWFLVLVLFFFKEKNKKRKLRENAVPHKWLSQKS